MKCHEEEVSSQLTHVILPFIVVLVISILSFVADKTFEDGNYWFQRSGALLVAISVYIAHHEVKVRYSIKGKILNIQTKIWYQWLALILGVLGTIIWAYGDLLFK